MAYKILDSCVACGTCIDECPVGAIQSTLITAFHAAHAQAFARTKQSLRTNRLTQDVN